MKGTTTKKSTCKRLSVLIVLAMLTGAWAALPANAQIPWPDPCPGCPR